MAAEYEAFTASTVLDSLNKRIETLDTWNGQIFAGLGDGTLLVLKPDASKADSPWQIVQALKGFGKRSITQLEVWHGKAMLLSLDDEGVSLFKLPSLKLHCLAHRSRGAQRFAWSSDRALLAVAVKRKLLMFHYNGNEFVELKDLSLPDTVLRMAWLGQSVCLGFRKEYALMNMDSGVLTDLFKSPAIAMVPLPPNEEVLVCKGNVGLVLGPDGRVVRKSTMTWSDAPIDLIYSQPHAIALLPNYVEIRSVHRVSAHGLAQVLPVRGLTVAAPSSVPDRGLVAAAGSEAGIQLLAAVPLHQQAACLADLEEFQEALRIASFIPEAESEEKQRVNNMLHIRYGHRLFAEGEFDEAMAHFGMCSNANPLVLLNLFPSLAPKALLEPLRSTIAGFRLPELPEPRDESYMQAVEILLPYLLSHRSRLAILREQDADREQNGDHASGETAEHDDDKEEGARLDGGSEPGQATINDLTTEQRASLEQLIDTAILKAMLVTSDSGALLRFVQRRNCVDLGAGEAALQAAGRYSELVAHYQSHGQHAKALTLLKTISLHQDKLPVPPRGAAAELGGVTGVWAAVRYLCNLQPTDVHLIKNHAIWILRADPEAGLDMFTSLGRHLPPAAALPILHNHAPALLAPYLEVSLEQGTAQPREYHNQLADIYLRASLAALDPDARGKDPQAELDGTAGRESDSHNTDANGQLEDRDPLRRLKHLVQTSQYINAPRLLQDLPKGKLPELRALLLERLGNHQEALRLYVHTMKSPMLAEAYCDRMYEAAVQAQSSGNRPYGNAPPSYAMYLTLIQVYLERSGTDAGEGDAPESSNWYQVAELLGRKHNIIDPLHALQLVPQQVPLKSMLAFMEGALRSGGEAYRNAAIVKSLRRSENFQVREESVKCKQKSLLVTFERACSICHRRLGPAAFVAFPDGRLAHYSCHKRTQLLNQSEDVPVA